MTDRVDFYVLKTSTAKQRWNFACRLTEKAYLHDLKVVVLSDTAADAAVVDELLWTFDERSFVPHSVSHGAHGESHDRSPDAATPVRLTADLRTVGHADLLINLSGRLPGGLDRFSRIAEIIDADDERRRLGRERFKSYRDLKLTLETHQLDDAGVV